MSSRFWKVSSFKLTLYLLFSVKILFCADESALSLNFLSTSSEMKCDDSVLVELLSKYEPPSNLEVIAAIEHISGKTLSEVIAAMEYSSKEVAVATKRRRGRSVKVKESKKKKCDSKESKRRLSSVSRLQDSFSEEKISVEQLEERVRSEELIYESVERTDGFIDRRCLVCGDIDICPANVMRKHVYNHLEHTRCLFEGCNEIRCYSSMLDHINRKHRHSAKFDIRSLSFKVGHALR